MNENELISKIKNINIKSTKFNKNIPGWFNSNESSLLYQLTSITQGPILEVGHFLGRSTSCICKAIKDSKKIRLFNSYDLGFKSDKDFEKFYTKIHKTKISTSKEYKNIVYKKNTTTTELADKYLKQKKLDKYVNLISGNFIKIEIKLFPFIFCDAMHEEHEIIHNLPHIIKHSEDVSIWAFHDMNEANIKIVTNYSNSKMVKLVDGLGIFIYKRKHPVPFCNINNVFREIKKILRIKFVN